VRLLAHRLPGRSLLLLALGLFVLAGCRAEEPPPAKSADQPTIGTGAASLVETTAVVPPEPFAPPIPVEENSPAPPSAPRQDEPLATPQKHPRPLVAIIIDDMGNNRSLGRQLLQLETQFSFSFLPYAPFTPELAQAARQTGRDILVHLPMEPKEKKWRLEPEALLVTDSPDQIRGKVERMLAVTPYATGASNHMGSRFSEDSARMRLVMETLQARSYFFIDSFTSAASQGLATARRLHLPSARRHLFLDNDQEATAICRQLDLLASLAHRQGQAIGIGHPHQAMLTALTQCGQDALQAVEVVGVHRLVQ